MNNRNWLTSNARQRQLFGSLRRSSMLKARLRLAWLLCAVTLMALALLCSGCQTQQSRPCEVQKLPMPPALSEPIPLVSYSEQWRMLAESSRLKLISTPATSKP